MPQTSSLQMHSLPPIHNPNAPLVRVLTTGPSTSCQAVCIHHHWVVIVCHVVSDQAPKPQLVICFHGPLLVPAFISWIPWKQMHDEVCDRVVVLEIHAVKENGGNKTVQREESTWDVSSSVLVSSSGSSAVNAACHCCPTLGHDSLASMFLSCSVTGYLLP